MKGAAIVIMLATSVAAARPAVTLESPREAAARSPVGEHKLGLRFGMGRLPIDHQPLLVVSIGIGVEHPGFGKTRVIGEYEWLWVGLAPADESMQTAFDGTGHRMHLGLRRTLADKTLARVLRFYVDADAGGGLTVASLPDHVAVRPHAFAGVRAGYTLFGRGRSAKRFECELVLRAIAIEEGVGFQFGIGLAWGN